MSARAFATKNAALTALVIYFTITLLEIVTFAILFPEKYMQYGFICSASRMAFLIGIVAPAVAGIHLFAPKFEKKNEDNISIGLIVITILVGVCVTVMEIDNPWLIPIIYGPNS